MSDPKQTTGEHNLPYPVWEFNYKPERYIHKTWLVDLPNAELLLKLIHTEEENKTTRLSHHLMSQLGFNGQFFFDFSDPITKLALWSGVELQHFVKYIGMMYHYDEVRQIIARDEVLAYRKALGDNLYNFALKKAATLNINLNPAKLSKSLPIKERVMISGLLVLYPAMQGYPPALQKRLVVKLPRKWYDYYIEHADKKNILSDSDVKRRVLINKVMQAVVKSKKRNVAKKKGNNHDA